MSDSRPIGVFDSGMGGLTVMRALKSRLPGESFIYLGDTARLPYGTKSADTVKRYAIQAARALEARGVKLVVIACNTASVSLPDVTEALAPLPVIGVIVPGAKAALAAAPDGPLAVIATETTVRGGAYRAAIRALGSDVPIVQQACPLFVPLAEEGLIEGPIVEAVAERYLAPVLETVPRPKGLLLACTHYPVLKTAIAKVAGDIALIDSAATTADAVAGLIAERDLASTAGTPFMQFLATDAPDRFARAGEIFLGQPIDPGRVELVDLQ
ncbi:MAG TPA: glutamate racemase [Rhizomicrobium sp.]|nr:glutamate racemase [Rhizomicrobium sp.]